MVLPENSFSLVFFVVDQCSQSEAISPSVLQAIPGALPLTDLASESFRLQHRAELPPSLSPNQMVLLQLRRQNQQHLLVSPALGVLLAMLCCSQRQDGHETNAFFSR